MNIIKKIALNKQLKRTREKSFVFLKDASSVVFYINNTFQKEIATEMANKFSFKFDLIYFDLINNKSDEFSKADFNFFYKIKTEKLNLALNDKYDVLINLTCEDNFYNYFISNIINAKFKVGASCYNKNYIDYDFTLQLINDKIDKDWCDALIKNLSKNE